MAVSYLSGVASDVVTMTMTMPVAKAIGELSSEVVNAIRAGMSSQDETTRIAYLGVAAQLVSGAVKLN